MYPCAPPMCLQAALDARSKELDELEKGMGLLEAQNKVGCCWLHCTAVLLCCVLRVL